MFTFHPLSLSTSLPLSFSPFLPVFSHEQRPHTTTLPENTRKRVILIFSFLFFFLSLLFTGRYRVQTKGHKGMGEKGNKTQHEKNTIESDKKKTKHVETHLPPYHKYPASPDMHLDGPGSRTNALLRCTVHKVLGQTGSSCWPTRTTDEPGHKLFFLGYRCQGKGA